MTRMRMRRRWVLNLGEPGVGFGSPARMVREYHIDWAQPVMNCERGKV
jgi:hypothetical protein